MAAASMASSAALSISSCDRCGCSGLGERAIEHLLDCELDLALDTKIGVGFEAADASEEARLLQLGALRHPAQELVLLDLAMRFQQSLGVCVRITFGIELRGNVKAVFVDQKPP